MAIWAAELAVEEVEDDEQEPLAVLGVDPATRMVGWGGDSFICGGWLSADWPGAAGLGVGG